MKILSIQTDALEQELAKVIGDTNRSYEILSASIVGSYHHAQDQREYNLNELDLYLVFNIETLPEEAYQCAIRQFSSWCERQTLSGRDKLNYSLETRFGPFEPQKEDDFQIHLLIDDITEGSLVLNTIKWNWTTKSRCLFGKPLSELGFFRPRGIHRREVIGTCYGGIQPYIADIKGDIIPYAEWISKEGRFKKERKRKRDNSGEERLHFMEHVCIVSLKNVLRYLEQGKRKFYHSSDNILSLSQAYFPERLEFIHRLDQRSIFVPDADIGQKAQEAVEFLEYLVSKVKINTPTV